jgi:hypothetical protein
MQRNRETVGECWETKKCANFNRTLSTRKVDIGCNMLRVIQIDAFIYKVVKGFLL